MENYLDLAFSPASKKLQELKGSRELYESAAQEWPVMHSFGEREVAHITARDSFYLASVGESGWPYVQHRGGEVGFVKVLDEKTIGWAERWGNKQYVNMGNLTADERVSIIMVDYPNRTRIKMFGHAVYHPHPDDELVESLGAGSLRHDGLVTVEIVSINWNCPKYITPRYTSQEMAELAEIVN